MLLCRPLRVCLKKRNLWIALAVLVIIILVVKFLPGNTANSNPTGNVVSNAVDVIVLNDERCKECAQVSKIVSQLEGSFPDLR